MNLSTLTGTIATAPGPAGHAPPPAPDQPLRSLPDDAAQRVVVHNEVHARPTVAIHLPALVVYVAMLNEDVTRELECQHLRLLPGLVSLESDRLAGNFQRFDFAGFSLTWERHTEFTRYSIVQQLSDSVCFEASDPNLMAARR